MQKRHREQGNGMYLFHDNDNNQLFHFPHKQRRMAPVFFFSLSEHLTIKKNWNYELIPLHNWSIKRVTLIQCLKVNVELKTKAVQELTIITKQAIYDMILCQMHLSLFNAKSF